MKPFFLLTGILLLTILVSACGEKVRRNTTNSIGSCNKAQLLSYFKEPKDQNEQLAVLVRDLRDLSKNGVQDKKVAEQLKCMMKESPGVGYAH